MVQAVCSLSRDSNWSLGSKKAVVGSVVVTRVCVCLWQDKTGGAIIHRAGGTVYLYRGRYYNYKDRPFIPLMLWKPLAPFYPKLVKPIPDGLTKEEVTAMRKRGKQIEAVKKLSKWTC